MDDEQAAETLLESIDKMDFSDADDDEHAGEDSEDESNQNDRGYTPTTGESIWANAADLFNPAKREAFI